MPSPFFRNSGPVEPSWSSVADPNTLIDGEIVWKYWGTNEPNFETLGRRTFRAITNDAVAAHSTLDIIIKRNLRNLDIGDSIVVTPEQLPPQGVTWQGIVTQNPERPTLKHLVLRLANIFNTPIPAVEITSTIDCWKH